MKKLGKPKPGLSNSRSLTKTEAKILGLTTKVFIYHEISGEVSLWTNAKNGGFNRVFDDPKKNYSCVFKLEDFWLK